MIDIETRCSFRHRDPLLVLRGRGGDEVPEDVLLLASPAPLLPGAQVSGVHRLMIYVEVDGKWHDLLEGGVNTRCGLDVPYGSPYVKADSGNVPDKLCKDCFPKEGKKAK